MSNNTSSAFMLSLTLHGGIVALILLIAFLLHQTKPEMPQIFELVAGEGENIGATEAPALGVTGGIKLDIPTPPTPVKAPVVAAPPEPVIERAPLPAAEKAPPKPVETKTPNFAKDVERIATKRENRLVEADRKKREAAEKKARAEEAKKKTMTKAEFDKLNKNKPVQTAKAGAALNPKKIDAEGIAKGVAGGSTANKSAGAGGAALTRAEQGQLENYIALLLQRLRAAHEKPPGLSDLLQARVEFRIAADGTLSGVKILTSSGSGEFDRSVLEAFARVRSIGPTPNRKSDVWVVSFKMREES
jgi:TonB family protein